MSEITKPLIVYLPDTRGVQLARYGKGNLKIGLGVYTYSRLPGSPTRPALGLTDETYKSLQVFRGTCPGSTPECERICYASRPVTESGPVATMWLRNSVSNAVPPIPEDAKLLRLHVSGDFNCVEYIDNWIARLTERPDVKCWVYTRSWRLPHLLIALERLRALPNVQVFASMDKSTPELPPDGWRRAWIDGDPRAGQSVKAIPAHSDAAVAMAFFELDKTQDGVKALICPEETKAVRNCEECGFCISGRRNDVIFLEH